MARRAHLPGENAAISDFRGACKAHLAAEHRVRAYFAGVTHLDQIIDLGAPPDAGFSYRCAVDHAVRLNFHIVLDDGDAGLAHLVPTPIGVARETVAIAAYRHSVLQ